MTAPTPTTPPTTLAAGDSCAWVRPCAECPPEDGWTLRYVFVGAEPLLIAAPQVAPGTYGAALTSADSAKLAVGTVRWAAQALRADERVTIDTGVLVVTPDLATTAADDLLTHDERTLNAITAVLEGRITADVQSYTIAGRSITKIPVTELARLRAIYSARVFRQRTGKFGVQHQVHLRPAEPQGLVPGFLNGRFS